MVSVKPVTSVKRRKAQCAIIIQFISKLHVHTIIKGYSLGSSSATVSVSGEAGVLDWAPRSRSRVFVPYRHNIKKAPRLSALQLRSGSDGDGPHKSLLQPAAVHTFTVYRGLVVDILGGCPLTFTAVNFHFGMNLYRRTLAILLVYIYAKK